MNNKSSYSWAARWYDFSLTVNGYRQGIRKFFARTSLSLPTALKILDVGCGTGLMSEILLEKFPLAQIPAFDIDEKMIEQFRQKIARWPSPRQVRLQINVGNLFEFSTADKFDLIVTGGVLESVPLQPAITRLKNFLAPNGFFLNIALKQNWFTRYILGYIFNLTPYELRTNLGALRQAGFNKVDIMPFRWNEFPVNLLKTGLLGS